MYPEIVEKITAGRLHIPETICEPLAGHHQGIHTVGPAGRLTWAPLAWTLEPSQGVGYSAQGGI